MRARGTGDDSEHQPDTRALAAMAEAARRSRQSGVGPEPRRSRAERSARPQSSPADGIRPSSSTDATASTRRSRRLRRTVLILSVGVVTLVGLVSWSAARSRGTSAANDNPVPVTRSSTQLPYTAPTGGPAASPSGSPSTSPSSTAPVPVTAPAPEPTSTPSSSPAVSDSAPALTTLDPSSGAAGQVLVINGTNLLSPSGTITAQFGGQNTTIACPQSTSCLIEVPSTNGTNGTAQVTVTTDGGTSNPVTFTYQ